MTVDTNQKLLDHMAGFITDTYDPKGQLFPMWTLIAEDGTAYVYITPFGDDDEKNRTAALMREMIKEKNAVRIGFMIETWIAVPPKDMSPEDVSKIIPSKQPDRREAVMLTVEDKYGASLTGWMEIKRAPNGNGILGALEPSSFTHMSGRFANMFDLEKKVVH